MPINETFSLKRLFKCKEYQENLHRSYAVYQITCSCKSTSIVQTSRNLNTCLKNHKPDSASRYKTLLSLIIWRKILTVK